MAELAWTLGKIAFMLLVIVGLLPVVIWAERKGAAFIQDRVGPNRASLGGVLRLGGLVHPLADVLKLMFKEDIVPTGVNRFFYNLAPFLMMTVALCTFAVLPFGDAIYLGDRVIPLRVASLDVGILYLLAVGSLGVYGIVLAGWSSNNKYSFLGALRASAQMISYELNMGLAVLALLLVYGSVRIDAMVVEQGQLLWGCLPRWGVVLQPVGFLIFLTSAFAETNRSPFDLPEGESELVAGYHTEYSSLKWALFYMAEYCNLIVASAVIASLYFGGWQVPWLDTFLLRTHAGGLLTATLIVLTLTGFLTAAVLGRRFERERGRYGDRREYEPLIEGVVAFLLGLATLCALLFARPWAVSSPAAAHLATAFQVGAFLAKTVCFCWLFIWVRWTLPRFRYDQLMRLGWRIMLPLALANLLATAVVVLIAGGKG